MTEYEAWLAMDARRRAKRRAQWRTSKRRKRAEWVQREHIVGWLHSLSCSGQPHRGKKGCVPIACYARPPLRVA